jgi:hypothetical protein
MPSPGFDSRSQIDPRQGGEKQSGLHRWAAGGDLAPRKPGGLTYKLSQTELIRQVLFSPFSYYRYFHAPYEPR